MGKAVIGPYEIEQFNVERFEYYWPSISKQLDTIEHMWSLWWTKDFIYNATINGRFQCWGVGNNSVIYGIVFTQVAIYPARHIFQVLLIFGDNLDETYESIDVVLTKYALENGCEIAEISGRPGWEVKLKSMGFRKVSTTLSKQLHEERVN